MISSFNSEEAGFTLKNSKGFSLLEVIAALAVFSFVVAAIVPFIVRIYEERITIEEERLALEILHNEIEMWLLEYTHEPPEDDDISKHSTVFHMSTQSETSSEEVKFCISWNGSNERRYEKCGYAKPWP
jgi:prepilin-type N-terminal cleavage/methylation domain-containing protein